MWSQFLWSLWCLLLRVAYTVKVLPRLFDRLLLQLQWRLCYVQPQNCFFHKVHQQFPLVFFCPILWVQLIKIPLRFSVDFSYVIENICIVCVLKENHIHSGDFSFKKTPEIFCLLRGTSLEIGPTIKIYRKNIEVRHFEEERRYTYKNPIRTNSINMSRVSHQATSSQKFILGQRKPPPEGFFPFVGFLK